MATADAAEDSSIVVAEYIPDDKIFPVAATDSTAPASPTSETDYSAAVDGNDGETLTLEPESTQRTDNINSSEASDIAGDSSVGSANKWPGWPGDCVFRLVVPMAKVGSIIGRKGEIIKKMCEESKARIRILDGAVGTSDRIVMISAREEIEVPLSPAMDALLRVFKRISGLSEIQSDATDSVAAGAELCLVRLLLSSTQAISLIGKQGTVIKSIQESTGTSMRVLSGDDVPLYAAADERIAELQGDALKVLKALEAVMGHLRKFLVDHSVLPLFEKAYNNLVPKDRKADPWSDKSSLHTAPQTGLVSENALSVKREFMFHDRDIHLESRLQSSGVSLDPVSSAIRSSGLGRPGASFITQITQTMQIPLSYAENIIGVGGSNIAFIRRTSGATLTLQESRGLPDEITVEIKGKSSQVQLAQQLIQEALNNDPDRIGSGYGYGLRSSSSYSNNAGLSYSSALPQDHGYSGYGDGGGGGGGGGGGYSSFRL